VKPCFPGCPLRTACTAALAPPRPRTTWSRASRPHTERTEGRHLQPTTQAGLNELLGEYKTATEFRVRGVKILDALLAADHPVRVAAFDNLLKSLDVTLVPGQPRMLPLEETLMWQRLGLDRAARLHDRRRMQMEDRIELSAALSRVACSLTEQGRFPVRMTVRVEDFTPVPRLQHVTHWESRRLEHVSPPVPFCYAMSCMFDEEQQEKVLKSSSRTQPATSPSPLPRIRLTLSLPHGGRAPRRKPCTERCRMLAAMQCNGSV
jgi:hypothetical protein